MVGDNPEADIVGGLAAGMKTVLVHNPMPSAADYTCVDLGEVAAILT